MIMKLSSVVAFFFRIFSFSTKIGALLNPTRLVKPLLRPRSSLFDKSIDVDNERKSVCVLGGGFGGLYSALQISKKLDKNTDLYLIDPKERFVFLPLLYELAVGCAAAVEVAPTYKNLLSGSKVQFIQGSVDYVDFDNQMCTVQLADNGTTVKTLSYDQLVISVGIQPRTDLIPGAKEHAIPFYGLNDALALKNKLKSLRSKQGQARVAVIGGGYSGVEVATNIAQSLGNKRGIVTVIDRNARVMTTSPPHNRKVAERALNRYNVDVKYNTSVKQVYEDYVTIVDQSGQETDLPSDLVLFTAGTCPSVFVKKLNIDKDPAGRILIKPTLQSKQYPNVFALGDCGAVEGSLVPATAQAAMQQSGVVAKNVLENIKAQKMAEKGTNYSPSFRYFNYLSLGEMLTVGDLDASITSLGGWVALSGPLASVGRRAVYAVRMPTNTQTLKALVTGSAVTTGKVLSRWFGG